MGRRSMWIESSGGRVQRRARRIYRLRHQQHGRRESGGGPGWENHARPARRSAPADVNRLLSFKDSVTIVAARRNPQRTVNGPAAVEGLWTPLRRDDSRPKRNNRFKIQ